jgi:hypothetical protein
VFNRGIAKRALFEAAADVALFLVGLAHVAERGLLEVHAFCVLTTHFHLLVRSPAGELSAAMQIVQNGYSRSPGWSSRRTSQTVSGSGRSSSLRPP